MKHIISSDKPSYCCIFESCRNTAYSQYSGKSHDIYCQFHSNQLNSDFELSFRPVVSEKPKVIKSISTSIVKPRIDETRNCIVEGCCLRAIYNNISTSAPLYCRKHKQDHMVHFRRKHCKECMTTPHYNLPGETEALYCNYHKKEGMIDIISKKCLEPGCNKYPSFNFQAQKTRLYCVTHKKEGMVCIRVRK